MRESIDKILQKLAVQRVLQPYETQPWALFDDERGISCSAEVRMGPGARDLEAEIQLLKDESEDDGGAGDEGSGGREQILWMRIEPVAGDQWSPKALRVKGKDYYNAFHDWEGKGCQFFRSCVEALMMGEIPDFDSMAEETMVDDSEQGGGRRGRVGRKSPKANASAILGMKK